MNEMIYVLAGAIPTIILAFIQHLLTKKKFTEEVRLAKADVQGKEIDNVEKANKIWQELSENMKIYLDTQIKELKEENASIKSNLEVVSKENKAIAGENKKIKCQLDRVQRENTNMRTQMASLENELKLTKVELKASKDENQKLTEQLRLFNINFASHENAFKG